MIDDLIIDHMDVQPVALLDSFWILRRRDELTSWYVVVDSSYPGILLELMGLTNMTSPVIPFR